MTALGIIASAVNPPLTIEVRNGQFAEAVDDTEAALVRAGAAVLVRAGQLVQPIAEERPAADGRKTQVTVLKSLTIAPLAYLISSHGYIYTKYNERRRAQVNMDPPERVLRGLLERGKWAFPHVTGVINVPTLRPDGTILDKPGYDQATGNSSASNSNAAFASSLVGLVGISGRLMRPSSCSHMSGFPFVQPLDKAVALAAILTAVCRGAFELAPAFLFRAPTASSGKSYLVDLIAAIITGRWCPVITVNRNAEEFAKQIGALLLEGVPLISLDNASVNLSGDQLCQMTERPVVKVRILGKSEQPECEWRGTMFGTGNNVGFAGDMTRRGLTSNLDPEVERPETRKFKTDPLAMIASARGKYIGAALTVARYAAVAECSPLGSYEAWGRCVRRPLIALGVEDPVLSIEQSRMEDPEKADHAALIELWRTHLGTTEAYSAAEIIAKVGNFTDFWGLLVARAGTPRGDVDSRRLGLWLRQINGRVMGGWRIVPSRTSSNHGNKWIVQEVVTKPAASA